MCFSRIRAQLLAIAVIGLVATVGNAQDHQIVENHNGDISHECHNCGDSCGDSANCGHCGNCCPSCCDSHRRDGKLGDCLRSSGPCCPRCGKSHPSHGPDGPMYRLHPAPIYAYSAVGIKATLTDQWNRSQAETYPWHGGYYHRQYGQPLALVVPPTSSFQTVYSWGAGQTKSVPIYAQFGRPAPSTLGGGEGYFAPTPYWPSNTDQFGVYPVRGPW